MSNFYTEPFVSAGEMEFPSEPYITAQPQNHTATGPETYVLKVIAAGAVSYQWEVFDGESWSAISGATSDTLTISIDSSMNGWRYRVLVTGADGSIVTSKAAQIAVKGVHEITLEGAIVTFMGPVTIMDLKANIVAVQSGNGDPSPDNVRPISGFSEVDIVRCGKNLFDASSVTVGTISCYSLTGDSALQSGFDYHLPNGTYILTVGSVFQAYVYMNVVNSDGSWVSSARITGNVSQQYSPSFTLTSGQYIKVFHATSGALNISSADMQIEKGSTSSTYEPYNGTTYPISLGDTYYGGVLDVTSGVLTVTHLRPNGEDLTWNRTTTVISGKYRFYATLTGLDSNGAGACSMYKQVPSTFSASEMGFAYYQGSIYVYDPDYATETKENFAAHMNGVQILYPLATPTTVQLTPTEVSALAGQNNIWANSGDISVTILR